MADHLTSRHPARINLWPIAVLRVYTGVFFAYHGFGKITNDQFPSGMIGFLNGRAESSPEFYRSFVEAVVLPNPQLFATLVGWGELAIGLALIVGLATRYASAAGVVMMANFWMAKGQGVLEGVNHDVVWLAIFLVLALVPAGKIAGLDDALSDRFRFLR
jgi:thiosulfate dehydrogenase [quinone] large subunit